MKKNKVAKKRIRLGIQFLEAQKSGWESEVDPETLKLSTDEKCVLGQIFGSFEQAINSLGLDPSIAVRMGFLKSKGIGNKRLTRVWKKVLAKRQTANA